LVFALRGRATPGYRAFPKRGNGAEFLDNGRCNLKDIVDFFLGVINAQAEAN
jgi:hypothetical protein